MKIRLLIWIRGRRRVRGGTLSLDGVPIYIRQYSYQYVTYMSHYNAHSNQFCNKWSPLHKPGPLVPFVGFAPDCLASRSGISSQVLGRHVRDGLVQRTLAQDYVGYSPTTGGGCHDTFVS